MRLHHDTHCDSYVIDNVGRLVCLYVCIFCVVSCLTVSVSMCAYFVLSPV
jgi:hypothetical protein